MKPIEWLRSDLEKETEEQREELQRLVSNTAGLDSLKDFARKIGASTTSTINIFSGGPVTEAEIVNNINITLQTKAMIASVQTASNYVFVTVILALISFLSMIAAFIAAC